MNNSQHLQGLNDQQRDAILCNEDIVFVDAGPGSGKTLLLVSKLIEIIVSSPTHQKIVSLSYTNTAARQLGERFSRKAKEYNLTARYSFFNGTIHSFCYRMMKRYRKDFFSQIILDDDELEEMSLEIERHFGGRYSRQVILSRLKSNDHEKDDELSRQINAMKDALNVLSIRDILLRFVQMLDDDPSFREWISDQITVIAIDEAQDLSRINYTILDRLITCIPNLKVFLVGDPRQNIFEFNGGSYRHLEEFLSLYPNHATKDLSISYRCSQSIADYVNGFSFSDCPNIRLQPVAGHPPGKVHLYPLSDEVMEAQKVYESIISIGDLNSCGVLCNNLLSTRQLIRLLNVNRIPYKVLGGRKAIKRHIRFLNHILRIMDTDNAYSIRKVSEYAGIDIMQEGRKSKDKFYDSHLGKTIAEIRDLASGIGFPVILSLVIERIMRKSSDNEERLRDYQELLDISGLFETIADYLLSFSTDKERFGRFYDKDYVECPLPVEDEYLTISTIHSAKGLEWDHVFVMGLSEGIFPNPYFAQDMTPEKRSAFYNSEWKKMYVAATRARKTLILTSPGAINRKGCWFRLSPSRFVRNLMTTIPVSATNRTADKSYVR